MKKLILIALFLSYFISAFPQSDSISKKSLKVNLNQWLTNKAGITFEKIISEQGAVYCSLAMIYSNKFLDPWAEAIFTSTALKYEGIYMAVGFKFGNPWKGIFNSVQANFIYEQYKNKTLWMGGMSGSSRANEYLLSQYKASTGLQYNLGYTIPIGNLVFMELSGGIGFKVPYVKTQYIDCRFCGINPIENRNDRLPNDNGFYITPTLHFGWVMGFRYGKKEILVNE